MLWNGCYEKKGIILRVVLITFFLRQEEQSVVMTGIVKEAYRLARKRECLIVSFRQ